MVRDRAPVGVTLAASRFLDAAQLGARAVETTTAGGICDPAVVVFNVVVRGNGSGGPRVDPARPAPLEMYQVKIIADVG